MSPINKELILEPGKLAGFASGSVILRYGEMVILSTVVLSPEPKEGVDFFPMIVDYEERFYAAGKISGSRFIKREGRPSDQAILTCRLIDRPLRTIFPESYRNDVQIIVTVLSYDPKYDPDTLSIIAASAALLSSPAPFYSPVAAVRIGEIGGKLVLNPSPKELERSFLNLVVAGTDSNILALEGEAKEISEEKILKAISLGLEGLKPAIEKQKKIFSQKLKEKKEIKIEEESFSLVLGQVKKYLAKKLAKVVRVIDRTERDEKISSLQEKVIKKFEGSYKQTELKIAFEKLLEQEVREAILKENLRPDGRALDEVRPISIEVGPLPRTHGSALFTRGQTEVISVVTLGAPGEEQVIETMEEEGTKRFIHHYNFPPFSTGEVKPLRGVSRREVGHGVLVERALLPIIPSKESFPYTIRIVSEILSSNGSTSMASVSGSSLALMDAGVPISTHVAGISIGLVVNDKPTDYKLLTDIQGIEDFAGDMDLKVAGTEKGITAIQLDTKIKNLNLNLISKALGQAKKGRNQILAKMKEAISAPRPNLSPYAPRIVSLKISPEKIGEVIGPGGKMINRIIQEAGGPAVTSIDIEDDGTILVSSTSPEDSIKAVSWIKNITRQAKIGEVFMGKVTRIVDFGAFVEIWPGQEGLVHISQLAPYRVRKVTDVVRVGEVIPVMVLNIDKEGKIDLSYKAAKGFDKKRKMGYNRD